ncbi:MAG: helix-turn-helix domain-containing protein [Bacilli bacterium]|nr:helix-turn-helix domain-containing protein [Bacilli bacterium]
MKRTFKDKMYVVQTYLKTGKYPILDKTGRRSSCRRAAYWVKLYKLHGEEGLKHVTKTYTARDRIKAVRLVIKGDSIMTVATTLGLSTSIVSKWYKTYLAKGFEGLKPKEYEFHKVPSKRDIAKNTVEFYLNNRYNIKYLLKERIRDKAKIEYLKKLYALTLSK